jgi:UDP-N-acetylmuramyl pentapeptide phosphotransferase/UDP-N-acetylglucosamine-1-phosphate transferase
MLRARVMKSVVDIPNERSLHTNPVPRIGGLGILAGVIVALLVFGASSSLLFLAGISLALAMVSFADDVWSLPVSVRFLVHFLAAIAVVLIHPDLWWVCPLAILAIVWMTNLYNFMDGIDGLAGSMALIGFFAYAVAAAEAGARDIAQFSLTLSAASLGFLVFNCPPAKIFMGDVGSISLGFLAGALGYLGFERHVWPLWFPVLVFSPFIFDATVTLIRRMLRGEKFWVAHRSHYYQRMTLMGFGHAGTTARWLAAMCAAAAAAVFARNISSVSAAVVIAAAIVVFGSAMLWVDSVYPGK